MRNPYIRRPVRLAALTLAAITITACASTMTASSHIERGIDMSRYKTFNWGPADELPTGDPRLDGNAVFKDQLQGAVERQMAARGFALGAGSADLLVHYHANISRRIDVRGVDRRSGDCVGRDCQAEVSEYDAGTLVIDIVDAGTQRVIWRGWAQDSLEGVLDNPERLEQKIKEAVPRILSTLPGTQGRR